MSNQVFSQDSVRVYSKSIVILAVLFTCLTSCSGSRETTLSFSGLPDMNSGGNPAVIRVYQLSENVNLSSTALDEFWNDDAGFLGGNLVKMEEEIRLYPEERKMLNLELQKNTGYVMVASYLRQPDPNRWYALYPASEVNGKQMAVTVNTSGLTVDLLN